MFMLVDDSAAQRTGYTGGRTAREKKGEGKRTEGRKARKGGSYKCNTATIVDIAAERGCTQVP
jgi:hypothetical protein